MLFSEPKIPQSLRRCVRPVRIAVSVLFSEPKIPQCPGRGTRIRRRGRVSVLFSEPKIPQSSLARGGDAEGAVSVLFSEPKIPQSCTWRSSSRRPMRFSALQRAENSSIGKRQFRRAPGASFQCSSASRKFLNIFATSIIFSQTKFQCSSASRKFLNDDGSPTLERIYRVSVLFSEPKIPQFYRLTRCVFGRTRRFQCSSASRKFLNLKSRKVSAVGALSFSALQRAENSSIESNPHCP